MADLPHYSDNEMRRMQREAIRQTEEMRRRARRDLPEDVPPKKKTAPPLKNKQEGPLSFLKNLTGDSDTGLILTVLLLLYRDDGDELLLFALVFLLL